MIKHENIKNSLKGFVMPPEAYVREEANPKKMRY